MINCTGKAGHRSMTFQCKIHVTYITINLCETTIFKLFSRNT